ncbi:MAG: Uncharacterized protein G01um10145_636 [Microgenomates group bacterium Gr01-1014_5]|nr:MAG: Uncharacterized protein G01um10145_636 [Microgenomates group bacterium Gr01-1014_5]
MAKFQNDKVRRVDKISQSLREDLFFDLLNAFGFVKNPVEAALLLEDLLTKKELDNLAKRLRIARELLNGKKQEEIITELHCGFGVIARVNSWINEGGEGLRRTISRLPKRKNMPNMNTAKIPLEFRAPQLAYQYIQYINANKENKKIRKFTERVEEKALTDKHIKEAQDDYYRELVWEKGKKRL